LPLDRGFDAGALSAEAIAARFQFDLQAARFAGLDNLVD
jgi:hypothetical protein